MQKAKLTKTYKTDKKVNETSRKKQSSHFVVRRLKFINDKKFLLTKAFQKIYCLVNGRKSFAIFI